MTARRRWSSSESFAKSGGAEPSKFTMRIAEWNVRNRKPGMRNPKSEMGWRVRYVTGDRAGMGIRALQRSVLPRGFPGGLLGMRPSLEALSRWSSIRHAGRPARAVSDSPLAGDLRKRLRPQAVFGSFCKRTFRSGERPGQRGATSCGTDMAHRPQRREWPKGILLLEKEAKQEVFDKLNVTSESLRLDR